VSGRPVAIVTGARRGIGRAIALSLARAGFDVAVTDVEPSAELSAVVSDIRGAGANGVALANDIAQIDTHGALLDAMESELGPADCLVNNAGVSVLSRGDLLDVTAASFDRCIAINTRGTFFLTQAFARRLIQRASTPAIHRSIVTVSSSNAIAVSPLRGEYCVSKAGLSMATTLFALRLASHGIGVYEVQPGLIETEMVAPSKARYDELIAAGLTAISRWGTPQDVAEVVTTMATGRLPYTVGQAVRVDGGLLIPKF
jgi:NAD(P)-dependent dehydrogenase (short-subunit alcohol dehydrogenase family)